MGRLRSVFLGPDGIRAGWSFLLFVLVYVAICLAIFAVLMVLPVPDGVHGHDIVSRIDAMKLGVPESILIWPVWNLLPVIVATAALLRIERRRWSFVLGASGVAARMSQGILAGIASVTLLVAALLVTRTLSVDRIASADADIWAWGARWAIAYVAVAAYEELLTRGYALRTLTRGLSFPWALALTTLWFMYLHVHSDGETPFGLIGVALFGAICAFSIWRTGSMWWAFGFHAAWDWSETFLFGVPNSGMPATHSVLVTHPLGPAWLSGGTAGPEGSIFMIPVIAALALMLLRCRTRPSIVARAADATRSPTSSTTS